MKNELVSIIVPIYNVEGFLDKCVNSLVSQDYSNVEIILVDDGSPDHCPEICDEWAMKDSRISVIHKDNGGLSDARNAGLAIAKGDMICFVDSDDWIEPQMIKKLKNQIDIDDSDVVSCGVNWISEDDCLIRKETVSKCEILDTHTAMTELIHDNKLKQHVWNKIYKTELIKSIPFEKGKYHEDIFWSYQVIGNAKKISVIPDPLYNYLQRSNSIMGERYSERRLDALDAMKLRCEFVENKFPDLYDDALYFYIGSCFFHLQTAIRTVSDDSIIDNILSRVDYRKTGNPTRNIDLKSKIWFFMFTHFPMLTCKLRNFLQVGL